MNEDERKGSPVLTVQRRRGSEDFWLVWIDQAIAGSIHSQKELDEMVAERRVDPKLVFFEPGAREQLESGGALPPGNRRR